MRRLPLVLLLALVLGGCGFSGLSDLPLPGSPDAGSAPRTITAEFDDVLNLTTDSTVRSDGVTVGKVTRIERKGWKAVVTMQVKRSVKVPENVRARVAQTSLLGEKYVDLQSPGDPTGTLADGASIALDRTSRGTEVEETLGAMALLLNGGGVAQLQTITKELDTALDDGRAKSFLRELETFVSTLDRNRDTIIAALESIDRLTKTVNADRATVERALDEIGPGVKSLAAQRKQLVSMLTRLSRFGDVTSTVIRESGDDLVADLKALQPVLAQLDAYGKRLPDAVSAALNFPFPENVLEAVKGDYTNLNVTVNLSPLGLLGNISGDQSLGDGLVDLIPGLSPVLPDVPDSGKAPSVLPVPVPTGLPSSVPTSVPSAGGSDPLRGLVGLLTGGQ